MFPCFSPSQASSQSIQSSIHTIVYLSSMLCPRSARGGGMSWLLSSRILRLLLGTESLQGYQHQHHFPAESVASLVQWLLSPFLWVLIFYGFEYLTLWWDTGQLLNSKCLGIRIRGSPVSCTSQDLILRRRKKASGYINTYLDHLTLKIVM